VVATGTIEPKREVEVRSRIAGIIEEIDVEEGDNVEKGQVLIEIEKELVEAQVREARAAVEAARVEQRFAKIELERLAELQRRRAVSDSDRDAANARHEQALTQVERAAAALDFLEVQLRYATVRAPLAGRVVEEGSAVSPVTAVTGGTVLLRIAGTDRLHLEGLVDENEIARVAVGQPARIRTEAFGDRTFQAKVRDIAPVGKRIQNVTYFELEIEVTDEDAQVLRPRMSADAEIVTGVVEDAVYVPETALRYEGERIYVETVAGGAEDGVGRSDVELGVVDGDKVQILSGLEPGQKVLLQ
jgi:HlyD family secretion protein